MIMEPPTDAWSESRVEAGTEEGGGEAGRQADRESDQRGCRFSVAKVTHSCRAKVAA